MGFTFHEENADCIIILLIFVELEKCLHSQNVYKYGVKNHDWLNLLIDIIIESWPIE